MCKNGVQLTERAIQLYREMARSIGQGPLALHLVWDVTAAESTGVWEVGLTPEAHFTAAGQQMLDKIIAGRFDGILVVIDGPIAKPASELSIKIDATATGGSFIAAID
ncbi:hypothetical protein AAFN88_16860 [Pelagibius sp. CAU 1746]|uniref:hypothetical protein n=1 Tax=Pelagibius sp. CAU 1746 TaxID=3140370 RepID=UPI00325BEAD4